MIFNRNEKEDLRILALSAILVPLIWLAFMGGFSEAFIGDDAVLALPRSADFLAMGGDWTRLLYRADLLGGINVADNWGKNALYWVAANLGLSPIGALNFAVIITQICFAFLATRACVGLAGQLAHENTRRILSWIEAIALISMFAFLPAICARLRNGHLDLLLGLFFFLVLATYLIAVRHRDLTFTLLAVGTVALVLCIPSQGHQTKFYGLFFGLPILIALVWPFHHWRAWLREPTLWIAGFAFLGACALGLPKFAGILHLATSTDTLRSLSANMVYDLIQFTPHDLLVSLPLDPSLIPHGRPDIFMIESAFAFGPCLIFLAVLAYRKEWPLFCGLVASLILTLIYAMNFEPFSTALIKIVPPLGSFRVPGRALMGFTLMLAIVAGAILLATKTVRWSGLAVMLTLGGAAAMLLLPPVTREILLWGVVGGVAWLMITRPQFAAFAKGSLLVILATGYLASQRAWIINLHPSRAALESAQLLGSQLKRQFPYLASSLNRVVLTGHQSIFSGQAGSAMGVSTLTGYWNSMRRFKVLVSGLMNANIRDDVMYFDFRRSDPIFPILQQMYNVNFDLDFTQNPLALHPLPERLGGAWFTHSLSSMPSIESIAQDLRGHQDSLKDYLQTHGMFAADDVKIHGLDLAVDSAKCAQAQMKDVGMGADRQTFAVNVETSANCPLVLAMNYSELLQARTSDHRGLPVFPIFGALTGVMVPAGVNFVLVHAVPFIPLWSQLGYWMGWIFLAAAVGTLGFTQLKAPRAAVIELKEKTSPKSKSYRKRAKA